MRPLVNMTYALDRAIWPWELIGHHLTSILLHVVNVLLLFQLAWVATEDMRRSRGASGPSERVSPVIVAFVSAALFGLHPMMTEAVAYISGRSEVLYGTFFLLALLAARRWMIGHGSRWAVIAVVLWVAALLSKEVAVFWPIMASLYDHYVLASPTEAWRKRFRRLYLPLLLLTATAGAARIGILVLVENPGEARIMWQYVRSRSSSRSGTAADRRADRPDDLPRGRGGQDAVRRLVPAGADVARAVARHRVAGPAHERARIARHVLVRAAAGALGDPRPARSRRADGGASGLHVGSRTVSGDWRGHGWAWAFFDTRSMRARCSSASSWRPG
jgi:hypothetical protein